MPLFDYQCQNCQTEVELLIRGDEKPECPECHSKKMDKLLSVPAAHVAHSGGLPMSGMEGGCGKPQCGQGRCMGGM
ncbi:Zinc ribbon domain protein [Anatilimnocola aggregata]|uniref:Zinc ribbon domain protein n=1 Tax=Anatilimnocola aggregata TaxID=2528021 RepID=A0A517YHY7_9BACT|nr:FmdB family zinc ribbon protein [Anatilimnocola aggregata]QDU29825.1 Zinc ribbon domain protein [Anatilimnocola aggregata]